MCGIGHKVFVRTGLGARTRALRADGNQITLSHSNQNTCLGANGCNIRHGPELASVGASASMGRVHTTAKRMHATTGVRGGI